MINKVLQFYNYDKALAYFEDRLMHIHQAPVKRSGFKAVAKPVLLLTVLKAIDNGTISANRFDYNLLESYYTTLFRQYFMQARQESLTPMYYPWYFMSHDDFWHLSWQGSEPIKTESPSAAFIRRNTTHVFFDDDLWTLISHHYYRQELMRFIIDQKIIAPLSSDDLEMAADEGLTIKNFLALLIAI